MSSEVEVRERGKKNEEEEEDDGDGGILDTIGDFVKDVGAKIAETFSFGTPDADLTHISIPHISMEEADIVMDVLITNPNPVPIPLVDIEYLIQSGEDKLVSGIIPDAGTIHAHGSETVKIPVNINFKNLTDTFQDINPGQIIPYLVRVTLIVDLPIVGNIRIPLTKEGEIPIPEKPDVDLERVKWTHLDMDETEAVLHLKVENVNPFQMGVNKFQCEIIFGDVSIGKAFLSETSMITEKGSDGKNGIGRLLVPISFRPKDFGSALWDMIRGRSTGYALKGSVDVDTPFGPMHLPFNREGGKTKFRGRDDDDDDDDDDDE